jgi:lipopolysaccharide/colanic/teichoic acid biosynthesis glycosyltransferase
MAAGLWWVVRSGAFERVAGIAKAESVVERVPERAWPSKNGSAPSQNGAVASHNGAVHAGNGAAPWVNGDRRKGSRLEAYFPLRGEAPRNRQWFRPWCLSRGKRICDIIGAVVGLIVLSPLMVVIAVAIKLDQPGPVLFRQWRTGLAARRFQMMKFRTMRQNAEQEKAALRALNQHGPHSPDFKIREDPRVTRVGRFLRRTSLDELPNLLNVLRGEMSLVGPRPTSFGIDVYEDWHLARLVVPPGVTGLWQISGRSEIDFDDRVRLDCRYIDKQSIMLDAKIVVLTAVRVFDGRGAC